MQSCSMDYRAFCTLPLEGVEAIAGLVSIYLHLWKLNSYYYFHYASISLFHAINSLLDSQHTKNQPPHRFSTSNLIPKQQAKLTSPIKDVNEQLSKITKCFCSLYSLLSFSSRVVDHFSNRITFHSPSSSSNEDLFKYIQNLNHVFHQLQNLPYHAGVIVDGGIKKSNIATATIHIWKDNQVIKQLQFQTINITSIKAKLIAICIGFISAIERDDIHNVIIITDSIAAANKILELYVNPF